MTGLFCKPVRVGLIGAGKFGSNVKVVRPVQKGQSLGWADVAMDTTTHAYQIRKQMEEMFAAPRLKAA